MGENTNISNEQLFDFMTKMYSDLSGKIDNVDKEMKENMATKDDLADMATKHDIVRLENKMDANDKALFDRYKQSIEGITEINEKLDKLTDRIENQEIKLQVLKSVK